MISIYTDTYIPYEFDNKREAIQFIKTKSHNIKGAIILCEKNTEHLLIRCPVSAEYLDIVSDVLTLNWLDEELKRLNMYRQR